MNKSRVGLYQMSFIKKTIMFFLFFMIIASYANALTTRQIQQETSSYIIQIKYPQGFVAARMNQIIAQFIAQQQKNFLATLAEDKDTPADAPGKTSLNINYAILYNKNKALSIRFDVSVYHKGAAHPLNTINVLNFLQEKPQQLSDLFKQHSNYLTTIASLCQQTLIKKDISDAQWIKNGTKAVPEQYNVWYFTPKGIAIVFNAYQVAAYVYGEQKVNISRTVLSPLMKPEVIKSVWSN